MTETPITRWQWLGRVMLDSELSASARIVAYWLYEHANKETMIAFPSVNTLAKLSGFSERQVKRARAALISRGWLALVQRAAGPKAGARYALRLLVAPISPRHVGIKAAERMYSADVGATPVTPRGDISDGTGVIRDTATGVRPDTQTSESKHHKVTSASSSDDDDADDEQTIQVVKSFKEFVHVFYGEDTRPFKPDVVLRQEAKFWLSADSGPSRTVIPAHRGQHSGDRGQFLMSV